MYSDIEKRILEGLEGLDESPFPAAHIFEDVGRENILMLSKRVLAEVKQLGREMRVLLSPMVALQALRNTRQKQYECLIRALRGHDIQNLPEELLLQIFSHCFHSVTIPLEYDYSLFILTWICKKWRDAILGNSEFWSNIAVIVGRQGSMSTIVTGEVLNRAKRCPLKLSIANSTSAKYDKHIWGVPQQIFANVDRISSLCLSTRPPHLNNDFFACLPNNIETRFLNTTRLSIRIESASSNSIEFLRRLLRGQMPNLTDIIVYHHDPYGTMQPLFGEAGWSKLTSIALRERVFPVAEIHGLLIACDRLVSLELGIRRDHDDVSPETPRIHLPLLRTLCISVDEPVDERTSHDAPMVLFRFLNLLSLPTVVRMDLSAAPNPLSFPDLLSSHLCTLETLEKLSLTGFKGIQAYNIVWNLPNLRTLEAPGVDLSRETIEALTGGTWRVKFSGDTYRAKAEDVPALIAMLEKHWTGSGIV